MCMHTNFNFITDSQMWISTVCDVLCDSVGSTGAFEVMKTNCLSFQM